MSKNKGIPIVEEGVTKGGTNPPSMSDARPPAPGGSGVQIMPDGLTYRPAITLPTKGELAAKIRATLTRTAQEQAMPIHRDVLHYFTEALTEALYVAPPVDPEKIEGVG